MVVVVVMMMTMMMIHVADKFCIDDFKLLFIRFCKLLNSSAQNI
jgi:hypothetical protein